MAHAHNPGYSRVRDQEDHSSKPAQANSSSRPYLEKPFTKNRVGGVAQGKGPEFKPELRRQRSGGWQLKASKGI
jgi:hypothetical protein